MGSGGGGFRFVGVCGVGEVGKDELSGKDVDARRCRGKNLSRGPVGCLWGWELVLRRGREEQGRLEVVGEEEGG